jgi:hypothetical protein
VAAAAGSLAVAILLDWRFGDDDPAPELSERELAEHVGLKREADDLERQARDWLLSQDEDDDARG